MDDWLNNAAQFAADFVQGYWEGAKFVVTAQEGLSKWTRQTVDTMILDGLAKAQVELYKYNSGYYSQEHPEPEPQSRRWYYQPEPKYDLKVEPMDEYGRTRAQYEEERAARQERYDAEDDMMNEQRAQYVPEEP